MALVGSPTNTGGFFSSQHSKAVRDEKDTEIVRGKDGNIVSVQRGTGKRNVAIINNNTTNGGIPA